MRSLIITELFLVALLLSIPSFRQAQKPQYSVIYEHDSRAVSTGEGRLLPNPSATPGAVRDGATAKELCSKSFRTEQYRHTTEKEKKQVCLAYRITAGCPGPGYEIDHLISLEIGGADNTENLWPQPIAQARMKDKLEDYLHRQVCGGKMTLLQAQDYIRLDWWTAYDAMVKQEPKGKR